MVGTMHDLSGLGFLLVGLVEEELMVGSDKHERMGL